MTGSKTTSMTVGEMRTACERGEDRTDWEWLRREVRDGVEPVEDPDAPDCSALLRKEIEHRRGDRSAAPILEPEVLEAFKAKGPGWQTLINRALKEWLQTHPNNA